MTPEQLASCLPERLSKWSPYFCAAELCYGVDPLLLAAICDRESLGGEYLKPKGPKGTGDHGHGRGIMQIDDRSHHRFVHATFDDSTPLWHDPAFSVLYAARLLYRNLVMCGQSLECAIAAYNCGVQRARTAFAQASPADRLKALNRLCTGGDYVTDVLRRRDQFRSALKPQGVA